MPCPNSEPCHFRLSGMISDFNTTMTISRESKQVAKELRTFLPTILAVQGMYASITTGAILEKNNYTVTQRCDGIIIPIPLLS